MMPHRGEIKLNLNCPIIIETFPMRRETFLSLKPLALAACQIIY